MNTYGYVGGNPLYFSDPLGLAPGDSFDSEGAAREDASAYIWSQVKYPFIAEMLGIDPENSYLVNVYQKECKSWTYGLIPVTVAIGPTFSRGKAASGPKGKVFRGGSKAERDSWYGNNDKDFQKWWHREGKRDFNDGHDIQDAENAREAAKYWNDIGKPVPK